MYNMAHCIRHSDYYLAVWGTYIYTYGKQSLKFAIILQQLLCVDAHKIIRLIVC